MSDKRRVVVTGLGVATPVGIGMDSFWDAVVSKKSGLKRIEAFDPSGLPCQVGAELPPFSLGDYIPKSYRKSAKVMAADIRIAVICAYHAVRDAGLNTKCIVDRGEADGPCNFDSTRFGANIGAGLISADLPELAGALATAASADGQFSMKEWGAEGMTNLTPLWLLKFLPNMLACHVTIVHDAQAPSNTITCAEASSHLAIGEAYRTITRGSADVCICGGAESKIAPMPIARPALWGRLNADSNDNPAQASRPFGKNRCGMIPSDGGGLVILESLDHAIGRGARIYAEVKGFGAAASVNHWSKPDESGAGLARAMRKALADADSKPGNVDLVAPFGVGTVDHDAGEMAAWNDVFGEHLREIPAVMTRGSLGNNGAGSGAIDFAATVMALHRNTVYPSINAEQLDDECRFRFAANDPIDAKITRAISVGYALAGTQNAALVIEAYRE